MSAVQRWGHTADSQVRQLWVHHPRCRRSPSPETWGGLWGTQNLVRCTDARATRRHGWFHHERDWARTYVLAVYLSWEFVVVVSGSVGGWLGRVRGGTHGTGVFPVHAGLVHAVR